MNGVDRLWHDEEAAQFGVVAFGIVARVAKMLCEADHEANGKSERKAGREVSEDDRGNGGEEGHAASASSETSGRCGSIALNVLAVGFHSSLSQPSKVLG